MQDSHHQGLLPSFGQDNMWLSLAATWLVALQWLMLHSMQRDICDDGLLYQKL